MQCMRREFHCHDTQCAHKHESLNNFDIFPDNSLQMHNNRKNFDLKFRRLLCICLRLQINCL